MQQVLDALGRRVHQRAQLHSGQRKRLLPLAPVVPVVCALAESPVAIGGCNVAAQSFSFAPRLSNSKSLSEQQCVSACIVDSPGHEVWGDFQAEQSTYNHTALHQQAGPLMPPTLAPTHSSLQALPLYENMHYN